MASILEGFLVRIGFDVDEHTTKKAVHTTDKIQSRLESAAKSAVSFSASFVLGMVKATTSLGRLYDQAEMLYSTPDSLKAVGRAFELIGGNADQAQNAVAGLAQMLKFDPTFESFLDTQLGVSARDANGNLRDTVDILLDVRNALARMPKEMLPGFAGAMGIDIATVERMMRTDFIPMMEQARKDVAQISGGIGGEVGKNNALLLRELNRLSANMNDLTEIAWGKFASESGFVKWLKAVNDNAHFASVGLTEFATSAGKAFGEYSSEANKLGKATEGLFKGIGALATEAGEVVGKAIKPVFAFLRDGLIDLGVSAEILMDDKLNVAQKIEKLLSDDVIALRIQKKITTGIELDESEKQYLSDYKTRKSIEQKEQTLKTKELKANPAQTVLNGLQNNANADEDTSVVESVLHGLQRDFDPEESADTSGAIFPEIDSSALITPPAYSPVTNTTNNQIQNNANITQNITINGATDPQGTANAIKSETKKARETAFSDMGAFYFSAA